MEQGNLAQAGGDIYGAEASYLKALEAAQQLPAQDLRRSTTRRNLAQVLALQGRYQDADSLYQNAILIALLSLEADHPYVRALHDDLTLLHKVMDESEKSEVDQPPPSFSLAEFLQNSARWLVTNSSIVLGASLPMTDILQMSNEQGFYYGLDVRIPLFDLGPLSGGVRLEYSSTTLAAKRSLDEPFSLEGIAFTFAPAIGPLILSGGAGYSNVYTDQGRHTSMTMMGGGGFKIRKKRGRQRQTKLQTTIHMRGIQIADTASDNNEPYTILQAALLFSLK
jgi:tetratricopeptide (TPR) repeat protein